MKLFFLRHGIAAEKGAYATDADRPLTEEGIKEMTKVAKAMGALGLEFDLILSSPFVRAKQTAEIVAEILHLGHCLKIHESLQVGGDSLKLIRDLNRSPEPPESVLLVGHEPSLSNLITLLLTGTHQAILSMKKAGLCKLETSSLKFGKCAELKWLLTPKQLVSIQTGR